MNPSAIHLTVPRGFRTRKAVPELYRLHRFDLDPAEISWHEGIPIVTPERAILGSIEQALDRQLIDQTIATARARGLITRPAAKRLTAMRQLSQTHLRLGSDSQVPPRLLVLLRREESRGSPCAPAPTCTAAS